MIRIDQYKAITKKRNARHTLGRCYRCNIAYIWKTSAKRTLREERCPKCNCHLDQTTTAYKGTWYEI